MLSRIGSLRLSAALLAASMSAAYAGTHQEEFSKASALWQAAALQRYEFSVEAISPIRTSCHTERPARLTVSKGKVIRGFYLRADNRTHGARIEGSCLRYFSTVDSLFKYIADNVGHCEGLKVIYDARYGYPAALERGCFLDDTVPIRIWDLTLE